MARTIEKQVNDTYFSLRVVLAVIAFSLPPLLWIGGKIAGFPLRPSMSAYYYATPAFPAPPAAPCKSTEAGGAAYTAPIVLAAGTMRNWFVGFLFAVGAILYVYKGYTERENVVLNFAGVMAVGIAVFPMPWTCGPSPKVTMHGTFAILFFLSIAFVCAFCSEATVKLIDNHKLRMRYRRLYRVLASVMVLSPAAAYLVNLLTSRDNYIFLAEMFGIYSFSVYWVIKIVEISSVGSEKAAIEQISGREGVNHSIQSAPRAAGA